MANQSSSTRENEGIAALALDGSTNLPHALSELYILQETAGRWAFSKELDLEGDEVRPSDMFDIIGGTGIGGFNAVLFVRLKMTIGQAIRSHRILERVFQSDAWKNKNQQACSETLNIALDEMINVSDVENSLDSPFAEKNPKTKCFVCVINPAAATSCRLLRNYRSRKDQAPRCTIRQVLHATLSNHAQLPAVCIEEELFISALNGYANPTHMLVKELGNAYTKGTHVACVVNVGAGDLGIQPLTSQTNAEELAGLLRSCQLVADDVASQCHDLGAFFFPFSVTSGLGEESCLSENEISRVKGLTKAYLSTDEISTRLDDLEERLSERFGVVSIERLNSLAGKDGESRMAARLAKVEEHLDGTIFKDMNNWLQPIHQTSKLDSNIRARSGTTCQWLLKNDIFMKWMETKCGLFWFRGLMGTGKTVMSSFVIETLRARGDIYVAFYYFEFTNPTTLSEEAVFRSLVCQLVGASPAVVRTLYQKHNNGGLQPQLATLQDSLNELVSASAKPVFIIIDALDELPPTQRKYFLQSLVTFSRSNVASQTHIMVTSREEVDIHRAFEGSVHFVLAVQGSLVRQDIAAFVDQELAEQKWKYWPRDAVEMARRLLNERAAGQFRMVACQIDILRQVTTFDQLQRSLNSLPTTLGETYDYILEKIPMAVRNQAHLLFAILSFAPEPISAHELSGLLAVEFGDEGDPTQLPVLQERNQMVDPLDVVDLGTSLVSRVGDYGETSLLLAHASVKEHLLTPSDTWFSLCEDLAHSMIARSCLALLVHFQILWQRRTSKFVWPGVLNSEVAVMYPYSSNKWFQHVLPNGSPQLLRQLQQIYESFPWPCLHEYNKWPYKWTMSPLVSAASFGLFDFVQALLNSRSWETEYLTRALIAAASSKRGELVAIQCCHALITHGADIDGLTRTFSVFGRGFSSPLEGASSKGNVEIVSFLLEKGADANAGGGKYGSALQAGASRGSLELVRFLVEKGADVNASGGMHGSALQAGAYRNSLEIVRFLVEKGADVNARGGQYGSALQAGAYRSSLEIVRFLVEKGADVNANGGEYGSALQVANHAFSSNPRLIHFLVENGADINAKGGLRGTALNAAAAYGRLEIVRFLVEKGADVHANGRKYGSALHYAAENGHLEVVRFLVGKGADVNISGGDHGSALHAAAFYGELETVRFLIEKGADVNACGEKHGSALQAGADHGGLAVVRLLVENGANVNAIGGLHKTALEAVRSDSFSSSYSDRDKVEQFLISCGAKTSRQILGDKESEP
ncbi:ankyrin repeat-containing domain protein [Flagelloscypha sp. PMI_526]|nr:ankyrin repeat-containing domain protein [Flagelloscypha sp. PMI_526]